MTEKLLIGMINHKTNKQTLFQFYIEREKCVVIVTSTTGDGEPPDTALKFMRRLRKKTLPGTYLAHLNYALLGRYDDGISNLQFRMFVFISIITLYVNQTQYEYSL